MGAIGEMRTCQVCGLGNAAESGDFCVRCGQSLHDATRSDSAETADAQSRPSEDGDVGQAAARVCECGAALEPGVPACDYCGGTQSTPAFVVTWAWGSMPLHNRVFIGRVPPVEPDLAQRLERDYGSVSRMHAEISVRDAIVSVRDFGSLNGTYINDMQIVPHQDVRVNLGDRIRFARTVEATIGLAAPGGGNA